MISPGSKDQPLSSPQVFSPSRGSQTPLKAVSGVQTDPPKNGTMTLLSLFKLFNTDLTV